MNNYHKYPRTYHLPHSNKSSSDDLKVNSYDMFKDKKVVITEKLDGENTTLYNDHLHARSISSKHHPSRSWLKNLHSQICKDIPNGFRICGENLYAYHSIWYKQLPTYFFVFGIYNDQNECLSWDETLEYCYLLNLEPVPVLYIGDWEEVDIQSFWSGIGTYPTYGTDITIPQESDFLPCEAEGYVIRTVDSFHYNVFANNVAKYVRNNHVKPNSGHWASKPVFPNLLK